MQELIILNARTGKFGIWGFGGYPQQAVVATDYFINAEIRIPPLLATQKTKMGVGEKLGKTTRE
ncbi:hypothetical protein [Aerosakkonema funiforme]|uniref:Uncharacterized protein n=1 Tax=Aerosakkonema funiforme FACHB-1375 TaxID=2949571 RepID=A0A926VLM4_9CYAN|nr:hypothetical protein [Aerosakkonema funiforme]MBD2186030.1 hypothetical protein [Aerosakkonema funiforme FACHB-1375]